MTLTPFQRLVAALTADNTVDLAHRLAAEGLDMAAYIQAVGDPGTLQALMEHCRDVYLVAALPATLQSLSQKACAGDDKAQARVLELFSERSPLKEQLGLAPEDMSDEGLEKALNSMVLQMEKKLKQLKGTPDEEEDAIAVGKFGSNSEPGS